MASQSSPFEMFVGASIVFLFVCAVIAFNAGIRAAGVYLLWNYAAVPMCPLMLYPIGWGIAWLCGFASLLLIR
jgi:hypothetical protein